MMKRGVMKRPMLTIAVLGASFALCDSYAFDFDAHGVLTKQAWSRFLETDPEVLPRLGIRDVEDAFGTNSYYDYRPADGAPPVRRNSLPFEERRIGADYI